VILVVLVMAGERSAAEETSDVGVREVADNT
jgi:hypothetical protein